MDNRLFGDFEPEDAWDAGDTHDEKVRNLHARMDWYDLAPTSERNRRRILEVVEDFANLTAPRYDPEYLRLRHRIEGAQG